MGNTSTSHTPQSAIHDRIFDAYLGAMGQSMMRNTHARVNWICRRVTGRTVIDLGCSQGLVSILLAREGYDVLGLDVSQQAIDEAIAFASSEAPQANARVKFIQADCLGYTPPSKVDTVIVAEVLEHFNHPARVVDACSGWLVENGTLLVTVPFGINDYLDHKQTFYLSGPIALLKKDFDIVELEVIGKWLGIVAKKKTFSHKQSNGADESIMSKSPLEIAEDGFYTIERRLTDELSTTRELLDLKTKKAGEAVLRHKEVVEVQVPTLEKKISTLRIALEHAEAECRAEREEKSRTIENLTTAEARIEELRQGTEQGQIRESIAARTIKDLRAQIHELQSKLDSLTHHQQATKETTSYQLASALARASTIAGMLDFPNQAYQIWRARRRRKRSERKRLAREPQKIRHKSVPGSTGQALEEVLLDAKLQSDAKVRLSRDTRKLVISLSTPERLAIVGRVWISDPADRTARYGLASISYFDLAGRLLTGSLPGLSHSEKVGAFLYLTLPQDYGVDFSLLELTPPSEAVKIELGFRVWNAKGEVYLQNRVDVVRREPTADSAQTLAALGWPAPERRGKVAAVTIFDEFSRSCFSPHATLIEPRPDNWEGLVDRFRPQFAFVESAWKGNGATWQYRVAKYAHPPGTELSQLAEGLRSRGIPSVFWNKEDPVHFDNFIDSARKFDLILTTAAEIIPKYRQHTSARVEALQFAAETTLHNPVDSGDRNQKVCFAGSFYANRFSERRADQLMLLDAAANFELDIFDRNYMPNGAASDMAFPERFRRHVRGKLTYSQTNQAYRKYRVFLNVNSVIDSPTMFSRRVFELLACGTPVVSTWAKGTEETFGTDLVWHVKSAEEARDALQTLLTDDREWHRRSLAGIRAVFANHTYKHRFQQILGYLSADATTDLIGSVLVIAEASSERDVQILINAFNRQEMPASCSKRMLLRVSKDLMPHRHDERIEFVPRSGPSAEFFSRYSFSQTDLVATMSPHAVYAKHYLQDLVHAASYSTAAVVGKRLGNDQGHTYQYGGALDPAAIVVNLAALPEHNMSIAEILAVPVTTGVSGPDGAVFASDAANFRRLAKTPTDQELGAILHEIEV